MFYFFIFLKIKVVLVLVDLDPSSKFGSQSSNSRNTDPIRIRFQNPGCLRHIENAGNILEPLRADKEPLRGNRHRIFLTSECYYFKVY